jgi:hypothetical protein
MVQRVLPLATLLRWSGMGLPTLRAVQRLTSCGLMLIIATWQDAGSDGSGESDVVDVSEVATPFLLCLAGPSLPLSLSPSLPLSSSLPTITITITITITSTHLASFFQK